ncbi:DUF5017 domain-containing protein [Chitinophaga caseinilytica]|uniref:DUF5017 domain-containing protein n=1 Tax=Chitinophaga caseinilytica TaxID=2267521 RepID=A0ABZ2Z061_9BACT
MKKLLYTIMGGLLAVSCSTKDSPSPDFNITVKSDSYPLGDTSFFYLTGNPYTLTFWAGDSTHQYKYRNRTTAAGKPEMQFTSYRQGGNQAGSLQLLISTDFPGVYDSASVYSPNTHWTDITDRATLSTGTTQTASGVIDLSEFGNGGKPVYIAYRYTGQKSAVAQRTWTVQTFSATNVVDEDQARMPVAANLAAGSWAVVKMKNPAVQWVLSASSFKVTGGAANSDEAESWIISKGLMLNKAVPDVGVPIKKMADNRLESYFTIYKSPGRYTATFEAATTTIYDSKSAVKSVDVNILP